MKAADFALYFDDPPVDPGSDSRGLGPINSRMIELFAPQQVVINCMRLRDGQTLYRPAGARYLSLLASLDGTMVRAAGRISRPLTTALETAFLRTANWPADQRAPYIFAPVGSDLGSVHRALLVARRARARLLLYLVDDPLDALRGRPGSDGQRKTRWLTAMLRQCHAVFGITEPLCRLLERHHGVAVTPLALPYIYDPAILPARTRNQIIYVGSVNEIYEQELLYWIATLDRIGFFDEGRLIVTGTVKPHRGVVMTSFASRRELEQEIADSKAALLSISSKQSDLCYSSFPSKTLDYLAFSRMILASAPEGSVVSDFFGGHDIPYCFPEGTIPVETVERLLANPKNHQDRYRRILSTHFSPSAFSAAVREKCAV